MIDQERAAMQQALEALTVAWQQNPRWQITESMHALRAALAQEQAEPVQEPVAWALHTGTRQGIKWNREVEHGTPLYTALQPQRKPLTDEEIDEIFRDLCSTPVGASYRTMARAIERKVRGEG